MCLKTNNNNGSSIFYLRSVQQKIKLFHQDHLQHWYQHCSLSRDHRLFGDLMKKNKNIFEIYSAYFKNRNRNKCFLFHWLIIWTNFWLPSPVPYAAYIIGVSPFESLKFTLTTAPESSNNLTISGLPKTVIFHQEMFFCEVFF